MKQVFSAMKAIIQKDNKFLLVKQVVNEQVFWDFPGGKINYKETPFEALFREVKEETGLEVEIIRPLGVCWFFREKDDNQVICSTFLCKIQNNSAAVIINNTEDEYLADFAWVTKEEFLSGVYCTSHSSFDEIIKNL